MARRDITGAVDFAYLENYAAGDQGLVDEVLTLFREQAALWGPLIDAEAQGWTDAVHTLKGAGRGVGAFALGAACEAAEAPELQPALLAVRLAAVRDALDAALADIAAYAHERALQSLRTP
ncbi:MAG: Hpt domain-containing protein [Proteobacteria bacterium]|nr:Hpt domain-containing protein [Pseudomonadota bacterium]MBW3616539.1 Hpt domain-containing protein [Pseudomonadota bacterium]